MNKIILNSAVLHRVLYEFLTPLIPEKDDYEVTVKCNNKILSFGNCEKTMDVEDLNTHLTKININMIKIRELISQSQEMMILHVSKEIRTLLITITYNIKV